MLPVRRTIVKLKFEIPVILSVPCFVWLSLEGNLAQSEASRRDSDLAVYHNATEPPADTKRRSGTVGRIRNT
jgi:hypothetical protein